MDHNIDWVNAVLKEILKQQMEDQLFLMAIHGISDDIRKDYRADSERVLESQTTLQDVRVPLARFQQTGLAIGRENKTKVTR